MALKAVLTGDLPDDVKTFYKPVDGKDKTFVLDVEAVEGYALEDVTGLKNTLGKERTEKDKLKQAVKAFEGLDPNETREKLTKLEELLKIDPTKQADEIANQKLEALKKQLTDRHQKEVEDREKAISRYRDTVYDLKIRATATEAIAAEKGVPELLLPHVQRQTRLKETDDGKFIVEVIDAAGNVRIGDANGNPMTIAQLVAEMKSSAVYGRAFEATGSGGSGGGHDNGGSNTGTKKAKDMSVAEKTAFIEKHGVEAWTKKLTG
jgi:hypothetical protein